MKKSKPQPRRPKLLRIQVPRKLSRRAEHGPRPTMPWARSFLILSIKPRRSTSSKRVPTKRRKLSTEALRTLSFWPLTPNH
jgi:hypothetical protein